MNSLEELEILRKELTRLLSHIAPEVEPASGVVDVYWQVDNAVCGLLKEHPTPPSPDASHYCLGSGKGKINGVEVGCLFCAKTGKIG